MSRSAISQSPMNRSFIIQTCLPRASRFGTLEIFVKYYISANKRVIDQDSYIRTESNGMFTFSWKLRLHEMDHATVLSSGLDISKSSVELTFHDLDKTNQSQLALFARIIDDVQNIVWSYLQHTKVSSLYFVIGAGDEKHSEPPGKETGARRNVLRRIFSGNTANIFLTFMFLSFVLFFIIGFYTVFVMTGFQFLYLNYWDWIILNM